MTTKVVLCCELCEAVRFLDRPAMKCVHCNGPHVLDTEAAFALDKVLRTWRRRRNLAARMKSALAKDRI